MLFASFYVEKNLCVCTEVGGWNNNGEKALIWLKNTIAIRNCTRLLLMRKICNRNITKLIKFTLPYKRFKIFIIK